MQRDGTGARPPDHPTGVRRSVGLFRAFRVEQTDPDRFYGLLARDALRMIGVHHPLPGATLLDVGAGPPHLARACTDAGIRYLGLDKDRAVARAAGAAAGQVTGDARALPFAGGSVDIAFSSNVLEHVPQPWLVADEMVRVVRPGGLVVLSYTNWLSPWGGHETSPWHYLGGYVATDRYGRRYGHPPKNRYGLELFPVSVRAGLRWAHGQPDATLLDARPRYLPSWCRPLLRVRGLREVVTWNLWLVLRRR